MAKFFILLIAALPLVCAAEIYKWTDETGRVHFGDKPQEKDNAELVSVKVNSYESVSYDSISPVQSVESKRVVMYSASWCGYCKKARNYFQQSGISYVEYDIEKDKRARQAYDSIRGNGVPVILVGGKRMNGFSVAGFQRIYQ
ncbi:glutaredoxin domain-containing protein [Pseudomonas sp. EA_35y_Pfl2_R5]|uniref:glutaredoxin domain-containing protein n=1 Tax=Pseudomonas sp. EA_35y_Pfl2_R5 TaxID=3088690 RepID=UPI0030D7B14D